MRKVATTGGQEIAIDESGTLRVLVFSPDGSMLASGNGAGVVQLWDSNGQLMQNLTEYTDLKWNTVHALAFNRDGTLLASASYGRLRVHNVASGLEHWAKDYLANVTSLVVSPDGSLLAVADDDGVLHLHNLDSGSLLAERADNFKSVNELAFAPDGTLLVGISDDGTLRIWACVEENN